MLRVLYGAFAALVMVIAMAFPAAADNSTWYEKHCQNYGSLTSCVETGYRTQTDGSGLRLEDFRLTSPNGCSYLASDGNGKYNPAYLLSGYRDSNVFYDELDFNGFYACDVYRDTEYNLTPDGASAHIVIHLDARMQNGTVHQFTFDYNICSYNNC